MKVLRVIDCLDPRVGGPAVSALNSAISAARAGVRCDIAVVVRPGDSEAPWWHAAVQRCRIGPWMSSALGDDLAAQIHEPPEPLRPVFGIEAVEDVWAAFRASGEHWLRPWSLFALFTWWASAEAATPSSR